MIFRTFDMLHKHKIIHQNAQITRANIPSTLVYINAVIEKYNKLYSLCMQLFCVFFSLSLSLSFSLYRGWNRNGVCISICTNIIFYLQINCEALGSSRKTIHNTMLDDEDEKKKLCVIVTERIRIDIVIITCVCQCLFYKIIPCLFDVTIHYNSNNNNKKKEEKYK